MNEVTTTKEKILEAASKCSTARDTLKILFPEVFKEDIYFDLGKPGKLFFNICEGHINIQVGNAAAPVELVGKCFYLDGSTVDWELRRVSGGSYLLIPTRKTGFK